jgi:cob(I)alamin adenosyltransferase
MEDCRMTDKPRILLFTGDGKGKTTAALGMALRASGHGLRTCIVQFIKNDSSVGEVAAAAATNTEIYQVGLGFLPPAEDASFANHRAAAQAGLQRAVEVLRSGRFAIIVLDEVCLAVARGLLEEQQVLELLAQVPPQTCLVLTGRYATAGLMNAADTVTEMRAIKHGLQTGHAAQKGVER